MSEVNIRKNVITFPNPKIITKNLAFTERIEFENTSNSSLRFCSTDTLNTLPAYRNIAEIPLLRHHSHVYCINLPPATIGRERECKLIIFVYFDSTFQILALKNTFGPLVYQCTTVESILLEHMWPNTQWTYSILLPVFKILMLRHIAAC